MVLVKSEICLSWNTLATPAQPGSLKTYQVVGLSDLIRRLFQPPLRPVDSAIAIINILLHVAHVIEVEPPFILLRRRRHLVLRLESFAVDLRAWPEILFCVREQIVRTSPYKVRATDFGVGDGELGVARWASGAN